MENNRESKSGAYATGVYHLAMLNQLEGNLEKAKTEYLKSIKAYQNLLGFVNPYLSNPNMNLGRFM